MKFETCYMCKNGVTIKVDEGFKFLGCLKNKNKWVGEIKKCPIDREEREKLKRKMKTNTCKEISKEIFEKIKKYIENAKSKVYVLGNNEFRKGYEKSIKDFDTVIDELRKEYGVEIEE